MQDMVTGKMAYLSEYLCKCENLSSVPQHSCINLAWPITTLLPSMLGSETGELLGLLAANLALG